MLHRILLFFLLIPLGVPSGLAQNTFQGAAKRVPESEVSRQSAFIEAELERQLGHYDKAAE
ncbi:MAG: hypothetical protein NZM41_12435, partial [Saprospiraceae bacterium]|nr:hypothetical protein [Saprospiraceae bacterium]